MFGLLWVHSDSQIPRQKGLIESLSFTLNSTPHILSLKSRWIINKCVVLLYILHSLSCTSGPNTLRLIIACFETHVSNSEREN